MPQTTPIYAFPYPCPGELITAATFANLANAIDTKMQDVVNDENYALGRYSASITSASNIAAPGVPLVTAGASSTYVLPASGLWEITAYMPTHTFSVATATSMRMRVRQNAVNRFGSMEKPGTSNIDNRQSCTGMILGVVGDTISTEILYTGPPVSYTYTVNIQAKLVVRTA